MTQQQNGIHYNKIVATIGPSLAKESILTKVVNCVDIFRINLSHAKDNSNQKYLDSIRKLDSSKAILLDTKGPEIRTQNEKEFNLNEGEEVIIVSSEKTIKDENKYITLDYHHLQDIEKETIINIDDSKLKLKVEKNENDYLYCSTINGGTVKSKKTVVFEGTTPNLPVLTEKDKEDIIWGIKNEVNLLAVSFIKSQQDILEIRNFLKENNGENLKIISKIETKDALDDIDNIIEASDGIMIARGDLGCSIPLEDLPINQINIIDKCNKYGKPVIIATQVLNSMVENNIPSRAELDEIVFNMLHGADSFMLSEETAIGEYPLSTLQRLFKAINSNQKYIRKDFNFTDIKGAEENTVTDYIIYNAYEISKELDIKAIVCPTITGYTPSKLSSLKPNSPIVSFTQDDNTYKYLNLLRGVKGYKVSSEFNYEGIKNIGKEMIRLLLKGHINMEDKILIVHSRLTNEAPNMINGLEIYKFKDL